MRFIFCLFLSLLASTSFLSAQNNLQQFVDKLNFSGTLPKNLLNDRAAVLVQSDDGPWQELSDEYHEAFFQLGIDAVAYYGLADIFAGEDATKLFSKVLLKRKIPILILARKAANKDYELIITRFNEKESFINPGELSYRKTAPELGELLSSFVNQVTASPLKRENYLVLEQPEFFSGSSIIEGKRILAFNPDLKFDKVAVPEFEVQTKLNERLGQIAETYPFAQETVKLSRGLKILKNAKFQYLLMKLEGPESSVKQLLGYEAEEFSNKHIHKYYLKQIYTNDVYLGETWDASESWDQAMTAFINNIKEELKVNN